MSKRTSDFSDPNKNSARRRATSVLPTPVGPRKKKQPTGRRGDLRPARLRRMARAKAVMALSWLMTRLRSEEHTSELQSHSDIVCRLLLEKKTEYTAIGDAVNTSSRLESNAKAGEILVSEVTVKAAHSRYQLAARNPISVENREQPVPLIA